MPAAVELPARPALARGVQLVGALQGSGFETQQWLVQRDERFIQLSELLYRILEPINGERTIDEIAAAAAATTGKPVSANNVTYVLATRFVPLGLIDGVTMPTPPGSVAASGGAGAQAKNAKKNSKQAGRSPLQLTLRFGVIGPRPVERGARALQHLFWPPVIAVVLMLTVLTQAWIVFVHGIGSTIVDVLSHPAVLLLISSFIMISAVFHEFGHASALRYGGGRARSMGFGLYFAYPAFYTDCTESYRLSRWARLRTDLGGIYFDLITMLGLMALYVVTRQELLLAAVLLMDLEIADQFSPVMRFDGYWALADLVGIPDFFALMGPVVRSMLPGRWRAKGQKAPPLKGWVKVVFLGYTLVTVPVLYVLFATLLAFAPMLFATYYNSLVEQIADWSYAQAHHDVAGMLIAGLQTGILALTAFFLGFAVYGLLRTLVRGIWALGHSTRRRRAAAWLLSAAAVVFFGYFWAPQVTALAPEFVRIATLSQAQQYGAPQGPAFVYRPQPMLVPSPGATASPAPAQANAQPTATPVPQGSQNGNGSQPVAQVNPGNPGANHNGSGGSTTGTTANPHPDPGAKPDPSTRKPPQNNPQPKPTPKPRPRPTPPPWWPTPPVSIPSPPSHP
jgi:putative peptide zinc metalloprotease protein